MYNKIQDYGIIGDMQTCALVSPQGSIDWCCLPSFGSPSVFAAILDQTRGGCFQLAPKDYAESELSYFEETNVLQAHFKAPQGHMTLTDFMPIDLSESRERSIFRRAFCYEGKIDLQVRFEPRFDYARQESVLSAYEGGILATCHGSDEIFLQSPFKLDIDGQNARGLVHMQAGQVAWFIVRYGRQKSASDDECEALLRKTIRHWLDWTRPAAEEWSDFDPSWRGLTVRSSLALKLLCEGNSGAMIAAPSTSLPEVMGGIRNWDYRYAWIRDAAFTVQGLYDLGHTQQASRYFHWIRKLCQTCDHPTDIRVMYGVDGDHVPQEIDLTHLEGYAGSKPVRIGNLAAQQLQLDIFGEIVNAVFETLFHGEQLLEPTWNLIKRVNEFVCEAWTQPDSGIWEIRRPPQNYTHSKIMCWVALDRGTRIARKFSYDFPESRWRETAQRIRKAVLEHGFNTRMNSFVQTFDGEDLDATSLLIPTLGFLPGNDPRVKGTIDAIIKYLTHKGLVYRYLVDDGLPGREGAFVICSFWLVSALLQAGEQHRAEEVFLSLAKRAGKLGLFSEEIDPSTGDYLGNFPQAFSHVGVINSSFYLARSRHREATGPK